MAGLFLVVQLLFAVVFGPQGRGVVQLGSTAAVFGVLWTLTMRPWLRISRADLAVGHGPFTRMRLGHAQVDVVRDVARASRRGRPSLHDIGSSPFGPRLVIVRANGYPVAVAVSDVAEAMDDLRAVGVPVSSTG